MELRKIVYEFILNSQEWNTYTSNRKKTSIISSFIWLLSILLIIISFFLLNEIRKYILYSSMAIILINISYIFISIYIYMRIFKRNIYIMINNNLIQILLKIKEDIKVDDLKHINIKIYDKNNNYNYKKALITSISDDITIKIQKIIDEL